MYRRKMEWYSKVLLSSIQPASNAASHGRIAFTITQKEPFGRLLGWCASGLFLHFNVQRVLVHERIVFHQLQTFGAVLGVFDRLVTTAAIFAAFECDYFDGTFFLSHSNKPCDLYLAQLYQKRLWHTTYRRTWLITWQSQLILVQSDLLSTHYMP